MADQVLTQDELNALFQSLTATLTGLRPNSGVRLSWPTRGAPGWKITDSIAFLRVTPTSSPYIQQRNATFVDAGDGVNVDVTTQSTRVHEVQWTIYSPSAYDLASALKDGLYTQAAHDTLAASNLYLVLDIPAPVRVPELFNGQWWDRCDLQANFNEDVLRYSQTPYLESAQVTLETEDGQEEVVQ